MAHNGKDGETIMSKVVAFKQSKKASPNTVNGKVPPRRQRNKDVRAREYLTKDEVDALMNAAGSTGRHRVLLG
jgi:hypothetical protein